MGEGAIVQLDLQVSSCTVTALLELWTSDGKLWEQVPFRINSVKHLNMTLQYSLPNPRWHLNRLTDVTTGLEMDKTTVWLTLGPRLVLHHLLLYLREQRES